MGTIDERERTCRCGEQYGSTDAIASIGAVLGKDRERAAFIDDAVQILVAERDRLRDALCAIAETTHDPERLNAAAKMTKIATDALNQTRS